MLVTAFFLADSNKYHGTPGFKWSISLLFIIAATELRSSSGRNNITRSIFAARLPLVYLERSSKYISATKLIIPSWFLVTLTTLLDSKIISSAILVLRLSI